MTSGIIPVVLDDAWTDFTIFLDRAEWLITQRWNERMRTWFMDLVGVTYPEYVKYGVGLVTGTDVLERLAIPVLGRMWVVDEFGLNETPTFEGFGRQFKLYYFGVNDVIK